MSGTKSFFAPHKVLLATRPPGRGLLSSDFRALNQMGPFSVSNMRVAPGRWAGLALCASRLVRRHAAHDDGSLDLGNKSAAVEWFCFGWAGFRVCRS